MERKKERKLKEGRKEGKDGGKKEGRKKGSKKYLSNTLVCLFFFFFLSTLVLFLGATVFLSQCFKDIRTFSNQGFLGIEFIRRQVLGESHPSPQSTH